MVTHFGSCPIVRPGYHQGGQQLLCWGLGLLQGGILDAIYSFQAQPGHPVSCVALLQVLYLGLLLWVVRQAASPTPGLLVSHSQGQPRTGLSLVCPPLGKQTEREARRRLSLSQVQWGWIEHWSAWGIHTGVHAPVELRTVCSFAQPPLCH